ncbi:MAG: hypothetical protein PF447_13440 [Spirochaetaceae bacterium]|jgi:hypothetical protein|nr:hypothetical protein [Spirochaetaceae bacterium]
MSKIKSALELALEKTADLKVDPVKVKKQQCQKDTKRLMSQIMSAEKEAKDWETFWKSMDKQDQQWAKEAALELLSSNVTLPRFNDDLKRLTSIKDALDILFPKRKKDLEELFKQVSGVYQQYLDGREQMNKNLMDQVEQQLQRKEAMMEQQTGRRVKLSPQDDPELMKLVNQQLQSFDDQYKEMTNQIKEQINGLN